MIDESNSNSNARVEEEEVEVVEAFSTISFW